MENHGQKRSADESSDLLEGIKGIICDIEGTTTPITFVQDKLFPYIRENVKSHLEARWDNDETKSDVKALRDQVAADQKAGVEGVKAIPDESSNQEEVIAALVANVKWQMDSDRKATALKALQGHMWREAYKTAKVQGEVYEDVVPAFKAWLDQGLKIYIYSSGSVEAQKLLFGYSNRGDLLDMFSGFFDTTIGPKVEKDSYLAISKDLGLSPSELLFLTDITTEAAAACEAGIRTTVVVRDGNAALSADDKKTFNTITSFSELCADGAVKRAADGEDNHGNGAAEEDGDSVDSADGDVVDDEDLDEDDVVDDDEGEDGAN